MLIAQAIPERDACWSCYLKLIRIIDIAAAPIISKGVCAVLKVLIEEHHTLFTEVYPTWSVIPKNYASLSRTTYCVGAFSKNVDDEM